MSSKKIVWTIVKIVLSIVLIMFIFSLVYKWAGKAYDFGFRIFAEEPVSPEPGMTMSVAIVEGKSVMEIGEILEEKGLIRSAVLFYAHEMFSDYHERLQPGIYELNTSMTPDEMMAVMAAGSGEEDDLSEMMESGNSDSSELLEEESGSVSEDAVGGE
ncbi:MAG: endolytic transglycosylase MltG [Lachnospiraceae bacterium]|nr:endolytic transglycosylase MltG [Lachnospiraceae bacterium]